MLNPFRLGPRLHRVVVPFNGGHCIQPEVGEVRRVFYGTLEVFGPEGSSPMDASTWRVWFFTLSQFTPLGLSDAPAPENIACTCANMLCIMAGSKLMPMFFRSSGSMLMPKGVWPPSPKSAPKGFCVWRRCPYRPGRLPLREGSKPCSCIFLMNSSRGRARWRRRRWGFSDM